MTTGAYLVHLHDRFGHAQHYLGWSADRPGRLRHHAAGTGSNLLRHVRLAGVTWSLVRVWPGADRNAERRLHNRGSAARLCPYCCSAERRVQLPGGGWLAPLVQLHANSAQPVPPVYVCWACEELGTRWRRWGRGQRPVCELHACAYAARQHAAVPFTTAA